MALVLPRVWAALEDAVVEAVGGFGRRLAALGMAVDEIELPERLERAARVHRVIMRYELARSYGPLYHAHRDDRLALSVAHAASD